MSDGVSPDFGISTSGALHRVGRGGAAARSSAFTLRGVEEEDTTSYSSQDGSWSAEGKSAVGVLTGFSSLEATLSAPVGLPPGEQGADAKKTAPGDALCS